MLLFGNENSPTLFTAGFLVPTTLIIYKVYYGSLQHCNEERRVRNAEAPCNWIREAEAAGVRYSGKRRGGGTQRTGM